MGLSKIIESFKCYLESSIFMTINEIQVMKGFSSQSTLRRMEAKWMAILDHFSSFLINFKPGKIHVLIDGLKRITVGKRFVNHVEVHYIKFPIVILAYESYKSTRPVLKPCLLAHQKLKERN